MTAPRNPAPQSPGVQHVTTTDLSERSAALTAALRAGDRIPAGRLLGFPELPNGDVWVDIAGAAALAGVTEKTITSWISHHRPKQTPFPPAHRIHYRLYWPRSDVLDWRTAQDQAAPTAPDAPGAPLHPPSTAGWSPGAFYRTARKPWDCECPGNGHHNCPHHDCAQHIAPGHRYVEYLGEAPAYRSGTRYCLPCGAATWRAAPSTR